MFPALLLLVLLAAAGKTALAVWLSRRQIATVLAGQARVPDGFADAVTPDEHRKAAAYTVARERLRMADQAAGLVLGAVLLLAGYDALYGAVAAAVPPSIWRSACFVLAVSAIGWLVDLPFALWGTFVIERRFGFNRTTPWIFVRDRAKGALLGLAITGPLLLACFSIMRLASGLWWLWTWVGLVGVVAGLSAAYPRWIAPLFNRFEPLPPGELRGRVEALMARCGFRASGLFTMDASRRSSHGNAYFTGFGRTKRIVLFDTLVERHTGEELEAVLAHELGHFHHRHVLWGMARAALGALLALWAFGWLTRQDWFLPAFGFHHRDDALALVGCLALAGVLSPLNTLAGNWLSRRAEFQADTFARRHVGADPMAAALLRLTRDNAGTLTPDPLYALFNYSHPPVPERVKRLRAPLA